MVGGGLSNRFRGWLNGSMRNEVKICMRLIMHCVIMSSSRQS